MFGIHGFDSALIFWGAIVLIVVVGNFFSYKTQESRHRMMEKMAEKGQPVPPDLMVNSGRDYGYRSYRYRSPIQSGIFLMCVGVALAVFFWAMNGGGDLLNGDRMPNWLPVI